jgi:hypothetical protein
MAADDKAAMGWAPARETAADDAAEQPERERRRYAWLYEDEDIWACAEDRQEPRA